MRVRRSESGFYGEPGGPDRRATARLRRACGAAHSRPAVDPTETTLDPLAPSRQGFSQPRSIDTLSVRNLTQNRRKIFQLNCVPRQCPSNCTHIPHPQNQLDTTRDPAWSTARMTY